MTLGETQGSVVIGGSGSQRVLSDLEEKKVLDIVKGLMDSLGKFQQYPTANEIVLGAMHEFLKHLSAWLRTHRALECVSVQGNLQVNKAILSMAAQKKDFLQALMFFLTERNVRTLEFRDGVGAGEVKIFFEFFTKPPKEIVGKKNMPRVLKRMGVRNINISSELLLEDVIIKTKISDELSHQLGRLNVPELLEKANIISRLDMGALTKVEGLASMVTNLSYTNNESMTRDILGRLAETLHDANPTRRMQSAKTFSQIAEKAVDYTLFGLHSEVGEMMTDQIGREDDPKVFSTLSHGLEKAAQVHIAKGNYGQAMNIIDSFSQRTSQADPSIRRLAESAVSKIASPATISTLVHSLEKADPGSEEAPMTALSTIGGKAVAELVDLVYTTDDQRVLGRAFKVLESIGQPALSEIYSELGEEMEDRFRIAFIKIVGEIGNVKSVVRLIPFFTHPNDDLREEVFRALLKIGGPAAENKVLELLGDGNFPGDFFRDRLHEFGTYRNRTMVNPLLDFLDGEGPFSKYPDPELPLLAVRVLSQIGGKDVVEGLGRKLETKKGFLGFGRGNKGKEKLQVAVCMALGRMGGLEAEGALKKALKSKFPTVRSAAQQAITALKPRSPEKPEVPKTPEPVPAQEVPSAASETIMAEPPGVLGDGEMDATLPPSGGDDLPTFLSEGGTGTCRIRVVLLVGDIIVDGPFIVIPGVDDKGRMTADQRGAEFDLAPGKYEIMVKDKDFEVTKEIEVTEDGQEIPVDLQDIFNF